MRRWWGWVGLMLTLAAPVYAVDTPTSTSTATATATATRTPTPIIIYCRDGSIRAVPSPLPANKVLCRINANCMGLCDGSGSISTDSGATWEGDWWEEDLSSDSGEAYVETTNTLPQGSNVRRCFSQTVDTVNTSNSLGYDLGLAGGADIFGHANGSIGSETFTSGIRVEGHAIVATSNVRVTVSEGGTFDDDDGVIRIVCFFDRFGALP